VIVMGSLVSLVLASTGLAQTATTTTTVATTTTTTTLLPHPFSPATGACIRQARATFRQCRATGGSGCRTAFETALPNCFKAGAGVTCASKCTSKEKSCLGSVPTTEKTCRMACKTANKSDVQHCKLIADGDNIWAGGDQSCLSTAQSNLDLCNFTCSEATQDCHTNLTFCIANCPNQ
jgi:hypothetical protein